MRHAKNIMKMIGFGEKKHLVRRLLRKLKMRMMTDQGLGLETKVIRKTNIFYN